jgi:hypothetical protein
VGVNNVISGTTDESSLHTDGNGIIMDLGGNVPPVLIANNLIYENGSRCIHSFHVQNTWVVNNTCYKNGLDTRQLGIGEIVGGGSDSRGNHFVNNIVQAWTGRYQYQLFNGAGATLDYDDGFGGLVGVTPRYALNPMFASPPAVDPLLAQQQRNAVPPWEIGASFMLQAGSPLVDAGVDPRNASGVTAALRAGMDRYLTRDLNGAARPQGSAFDLGAYER